MMTLEADSVNVQYRRWIWGTLSLTLMVLISLN